MAIIQQVEIKNFRSFGNRTGETTKLEKVGSLNIISGANDSGKSNILRALNLFFNDNTDLNTFFDFQRDFFRKEKLGDSDVKQELTTIKIWFVNNKNKNKNKNNPSKVFLPESFWVSKKWTKTSKYTFHARDSNIEKSFQREKGDFAIFIDPNGDQKSLKSPTKASLQKQLTDFLGQIQYHYIPAIKDKEYFAHLFGELQQTLWKEKKSMVEKRKDAFQEEIQKETQELMKEFKGTLVNQSLDYEPIFQLPADLVNLFKTLQVQTGNIDLRQRGDGVQAKLIPEILNFIAQKEQSYTSRTVRKGIQSKKYFIWGFEEPENSYEYTNAQLLADRLKNVFSQKSQIFITTHSFNFLSIESGNTSKYRVWHDETISSSRIAYIKKDEGDNYFSDEPNLNNSYNLHGELGIFSLNKELEEVFQKAEELRNQLNSKVEKLKQAKTYLLVEDEYDQIYKIAWLKLNDVEFIEDNIAEVFQEKCDFEIMGLKGAGAVAGLLRAKNISMHKDSRIVGLFDFDKEGHENFYNLTKENFWRPKNWASKQKEGKFRAISGDKLTCHYLKRNDHPFFAAMLLPIPKALESLADLSFSNFASYIEVENLLPSSFLNKNNYVEEKPLAGGASYEKIKEKAKSNLWKKTICLPKEDFKNFIPLFERFDSLTQDKTEPDDMPATVITPNIREGLEEAFIEEIMPLSEMWESTNNE